MLVYPFSALAMVRSACSGWPHADRCLGNCGERHAHAQVRPNKVLASLFSFGPEPQKFLVGVHIDILGDHDFGDRCVGVVAVASGESSHHTTKRMWRWLWLQRITDGTYEHTRQEWLLDEWALPI